MRLLPKIWFSYSVQRLFAIFKYGYFRERMKWSIDSAGQKGNGLYACQEISQGEVVFVARGPVREWESVTADDGATNVNWYGIAKNLWIEMSPPYVLANHSCEPNMAIDGARTFVALKPIGVGEELVFDYSITDDEDTWSMTCFCGSEDCRKTISSITTLPIAHFENSHPYIPSYFQTVYRTNLMNDRQQIANKSS